MHLLPHYNTDEDFVQAREMWKVLDKSNEQNAFVHNVSGHLKSALPEVQMDTISKLTSPLIYLRLYFLAVLTRCARHVQKRNPELGSWINKALLSYILGKR